MPCPHQNLLKSAKAMTLLAAALLAGCVSEGGSSSGGGVGGGASAATTPGGPAGSAPSTGTRAPAKTVATPAPPQAATTAPQKSAAPASSPTSAAPAAAKHPPLLARFEGTLPCGDCLGVKTALDLFDDFDTYELRETFIGGPKDGNTKVTRGKWTSLRGSDADPDDTVYEVGYDRPEGARYFLKINDRDIKALDTNQREIKSAKNLVLKRTDNGRAF